MEELAETVALAPEDIHRLKEGGSIVLDVRHAAAWGAGHVPGSVNIGLGGQFASWAGSLLPGGTAIVIVADDGDGVTEAVLRLARVGVESVKGFLDGGMYAWDKAGLEIGQTPQMPVDEVEARLDENAQLQIIDVRRPGSSLHILVADGSYSRVL